MITVAVGDLELPGEVQREHGRTVEGVGPVLEQKTVSVGCVRDVEQPSAESEEGKPEVFRDQTKEQLQAAVGWRHDGATHVRVAVIVAAFALTAAALA
ncbi:hypothetical protein [Streptomyces sp. NPDC046985]|uniref:hypothetical protein n=1 Tax=Streptomyces sp. NPDC046985 TaxID=3155377 RepID=UPI0033FB1FB2